jgi:hypothetical protein
VKRILAKAAPPPKSERWKWIGYVGLVLAELFYLGIVIGIFASAESKFQTICFSILVTIYNAIASVGSVLVNIAFRLGQQMNTIHGDLGRSLKFKIPITDQYEFKKTLDKLDKKAAIHLVVLSIGGVIALWHLVAAIIQ